MGRPSVGAHSIRMVRFGTPAVKKGNIGGMKVVAYFVASLLLSGCDQTPPKPAQAAQPKSEGPPIHRFESVSTTGSLGVAMDTATGQWCRTWDWSYKATTLNGGLDTLPTCLSLFQQTPQTDADGFKQFGGAANPK